MFEFSLCRAHQGSGHWIEQLPGISAVPLARRVQIRAKNAHRLVWWHTARTRSRRPGFVVRASTAPASSKRWPFNPRLTLRSCSGYDPFMW